MSDITVGQYLFLEEWSSLREALGSAPSLKIENLEGNPQDVVTFLSGEKSVLLFVSLGSKDDLIALANLVKMSKKVLKDTPYKIIVVNFTGNKNVEKAILKMGILDILEDGIKPRALRFKIDFWVKSLSHSLKNKPGHEVKREVKTVESAQAEKKNDAPVWLNGLDEEADIWLIKNETEVKKILGRWLVKMMGPSPHVASWVDVEGERGVWKFLVKESHRGIFLLNQGNWFFRGDNKPEYNWKEHLWTMAGDRIELFYQENKVVKPRFFIKDKVLQIAKNSDFAKTKTELIQETFNQEHVFKREVEANVGNQEIDGASVAGVDLKGKGSTDTLNGDPLSGKTKTGADQYSDLSGKGSTDSLDYGALKGKGKTDSLRDNSPEISLDAISESGPLKGRQEGESLSSLYQNELKKNRPLVQGMSEDSHEGFKEKETSPLQGKSQTSFEESFYKNDAKKSSSSGEKDESKSRSSSVDRYDDKKEGQAGKNRYESDDLKKDGEDKAIEKYYKEHNEATQYEGKDLAGKGQRADHLSGHISSNVRATKNEDKENQERSGSSLNTKKEQKDERSASDIYKPNVMLDSILDNDKGPGQNNKTDKTEKPAAKENSTSSNVYPIRPRQSEEIEFEAGDENELLLEGEGSLTEISQSAKVFTFITQGSIKRLCDLDDYFDDMVILRVSGGDFMELQPVQLDLSFHYLKEKMPLKVNGVIEGVDADENNYFYVTVRLREEQVNQFENFMTMFQKRQSHIHQFMKRAKGL